MNKNVLIGILAFIILLSLYFWKGTVDKYEELQGLNTVLVDSLKVSRNQNGELVAKISAFETQKTEDFLRYKTLDSLTIELQKEVREVKKYLRRQGSVTKFSTDTKVDTQVPTEVTDSIGEQPIYNSRFNLDNWVFGNISAASDSTRIQLNVRNDYSVVVGRESTGFLGLGKGKSFVQVTNRNPYSTTRTLKTYNVSVPDPKRWGLGPYIGVDILGRPSVGLSVNYNLIQF